MKPVCGWCSISRPFFFISFPKVRHRGLGYVAVAGINLICKESLSSSCTTTAPSLGLASQCSNRLPCGSTVHSMATAAGSCRNMIGNGTQKLW